MGRKINVFAPQVILPGDLDSNPGMCPDWESKWQAFGSQPALNPLSCTGQG